MKLNDGRLARVRHERVTYIDGTVMPHGGVTVVEIYLTAEDMKIEKWISQGVAFCRPDENYNKRLGRTIALGRALKVLTKED